MNDTFELLLFLIPYGLIAFTSLIFAVRLAAALIEQRLTGNCSSDIAALSLYCTIGAVLCYVYPQLVGFVFCSLGNAAFDGGWKKFVTVTAFMVLLAVRSLLLLINKRKREAKRSGTKSGFREQIKKIFRHPDLSGKR